MKCFFLVVICLISLTGRSQVRLLDLQDFDQRLANGKDTTYVVNFWATWCAPCVAELPHFERLQREGASSPLKVILISVDSKAKIRQLVEPFVEKHGIRSEVFVFEEPDQQTFIDHVDKRWSGSVPATLFVNASASRRDFYEREFSYEELKSLTINPD